MELAIERYSKVFWPVFSLRVMSGAGSKAGSGLGVVCTVLPAKVCLFASFAMLMGDRLGEYPLNVGAGDSLPADTCLLLAEIATSVVALFGTISGA